MLVKGATCRRDYDDGHITQYINRCANIRQMMLDPLVSLLLAGSSPALIMLCDTWLLALLGQDM